MTLKKEADRRGEPRREKSSELDRIDWKRWRAEMRTWSSATAITAGAILVVGAPLAWLTFESMKWVAMGGGPDSELGEIVETMLSWGIDWQTLLMAVVAFMLASRSMWIPIPRTRGSIEREKLEDQRRFEEVDRIYREHLG